MFLFLFYIDYLSFMQVASKSIYKPDRVLIRAIKIGGIPENDALKQLYKQNLTPVTSFVLKNSGSEIDAKEMLQEAIITLYENIKSGQFEAKAKLSTYLFSVAKNKWYSQLKRKEIPTESPVDKNTPNNGFTILDQESIQRNEWVIGLMNHLKNDCKEILIYSIYQKYSMSEIAEMMNFKNEQIARNKKSKCLGYFKKIVLDYTKANQQIL